MSLTDRKYRPLFLPLGLLAAGAGAGRLIGGLAGPSIFAALRRDPNDLADTVAFASNFLAPLLSSGDNLALLLGLAGLLVSLPVAARLSKREA